MKLFLITAASLLLSVSSPAQSYDELLAKAAEALAKKEYCAAFRQFERAFADTARAGTYDLAFGAVAAANCQQPDVAIQWLRRSAAKGLGQNPGETEQVIADSAFAPLHRHPDWPGWATMMRENQARREELARQQRQHWQQRTTQNAIVAPETGKAYGQAPAGFARYVSRADTLDVPYLVRVPEHYTPARRYPLVVYLHGGVATTDTFGDADPAVANEPIFQAVPHALVLYPFGRKTFGWVAQEPAFRHVLTLIDEVARRYSLDPNQIYLGGTSNGATAAFWYAAHTPGRFAGFYAFSPAPSVFMDPDAFKRIPARTRILSVSAGDDDVYPYEQALATYNTHRKRLTHWLFTTQATGGHGFIYGPDGAQIMRQTLDRLLKP